MNNKRSKKVSFKKFFCRCNGKCLSFQMNALLVSPFYKEIESRGEKSKMLLNLFCTIFYGKKELKI